MTLLTCKSEWPSPRQACTLHTLRQLLVYSLHLQNHIAAHRSLSQMTAAAQHSDRRCSQTSLFRIVPGSGLLLFFWKHETCTTVEIVKGSRVCAHVLSTSSGLQYPSHVLHTIRTKHIIICMIISVRSLHTLFGRSDRTKYPFPRRSSPTLNSCLSTKSWKFTS